MSRLYFRTQLAAQMLVPISAAIVMIGCSPSTSTTATPPSGQKTVLRVWQTETDKRAKEVLQNMKQAFEAKYSNVDVQIESVGWS